ACDHAVLGFAPHNGLAAPDDQVVQQHAADHHGNHAEVELANPAHREAAGVGGERCVHVYLADHKLFGDAGMALAAGLHQVCAIDGRARIAGGKDVVHPVATGAIGDDWRSEL